MAFRPPFRRNPERGYILLTLMLAVTLLAIAAVAIAPSIAFQYKRDREEELIHRGVQYSRAIRHYYKKFGRYPTRMEDLENTNNLRFLRRRYKDPITGKDFKLLHFGEVQMTLGGAIAGATAVNAMAAGAMAGGAMGAAGAGPGGQQAFSLSKSTGQAAQQVMQTAMVAQAASAAAASASSAASSMNGNDSSSNDQPTSMGGGLGGQVFGGGPIVGVVSASKEETVREFNNKNHYNQWQFIYDPGTDRGGLLNTPAQPALAIAVQNGQPGATGPTGATGTPGAAGPGGMGLGSGLGMGSFGSQGPPMQNQPPQQQPQPQQQQ